MWDEWKHDAFWKCEALELAAALPWGWSLRSPVASLVSLIQGRADLLAAEALAVPHLPIKVNILRLAGLRPRGYSLGAVSL